MNDAGARMNPFPLEWYVNDEWIMSKFKTCQGYDSPVPISEQSRILIRTVLTFVSLSKLSQGQANLFLLIVIIGLTQLKNKNIEISVSINDSQKLEALELGDLLKCNTSSRVSKQIEKVILQISFS